MLQTNVTGKEAQLKSKCEWPLKMAHRSSFHVYINSDVTESDDVRVDSF